MTRDRGKQTLLHKDKELVDRLLVGNRDAFEEFFEKNAQGVLRFTLKRLGGDLETAQEIVQTALCNAVAGIETYRGEASLFTWLCTCCHYEILRHRKRSARTPLHLAINDPGLSTSEIFQDRRNPEQDFRELEMKDRVHLTLDALPSRYGEVLEWKYLQHLSVEEIGVRLDVSTKAAESTLSRARRAFKRSFGSSPTGRELWSERASRSHTMKSRKVP